MADWGVEKSPRAKIPSGLVIPTGGTDPRLRWDALGVSRRRRGRLRGAARTPSRGCAALSLSARLQVCDLGLLLDVGVAFWFLLDVRLVFWFLLDVGVLGRCIVYVFLHVGLLWLLFVLFWDGGLLVLLFVRFWTDGLITDTPVRPTLEKRDYAMDLMNQDQLRVLQPPTIQQ
jgi:hypothetical protein